MSTRTPAILVLTVAVLTATGCGSNDAKPAKAARAINAPFTFKVSGSAVTVTIDAKEGTPSGNEPVQVLCANLAPNGFSDRDKASTTWKRGASSVTTTLPTSPDGLDLCAISFTGHPGKQAVAFFDEQAKAKYIADQKTSK